MDGIMKRVVLCADDFGMTAGVSRGILELAALGRISATSVMTNAPAWRDAAPELRGLDGRIGCGLHVNLTAGKPLGPMPGFAPGGSFPELGQVIRSALLAALPIGEIEAEIGRQLDAFAQRFGRMPDFVDGHQHVHVLPGIRGALLRRLAAAGLEGRVWLRDPSDRVAAILRRRFEASKALLVRALATGFAAEARRRGFATNDGFSGFSDFSERRDLDVDFRRFLTGLGPLPVVMCHPGHVDDGAGLDGVTGARGREWDYLASGRFGRLLEKRRITLVASPVD